MARAIPRFLAGTVAMLIAPFGIEAATLGDIEVLSRPGEPLVAAISVDATANERIEASCVFLSRGSPETGPYVTGAKVGFETRTGRLFLHLRSNEAVSNPASRLRVVLRCPGETTFAYREYTALFTAPPALAPVAPAVVPPPAAAQTTAAPAPSVPATPLASGGFPVQPGDSLDSIASLIFPREMDARRLYIDALREANPALGSIAPRDALPAGTRLSLPDLRTFAQGRVIAPRDAPAPVATPRAVAPRKPPIAEPGPPKLAPAPAPRVAPPTERVKPAPAPKAVPAAPIASSPERTAAPKASAPTAPSGPSFVLKLSSSPVDLSRSRNIDDRERARIRERQRVLESDDHVAAFLALRDSVQRLEGRVAELQLRLSTLSATQARIATPEPAPAPAKAAPQVEATPPPKPEPPKPEPPKVESAPPAKVVVSPPAPAPVEPPKADPPKPEVRAPDPVKQAPAKTTETAASANLPNWLWIVVAVLAVFIALLAWWLLTRRRASAADEVFDEGPPSAGLPLAADPPVADHMEQFEIGDDAAIDVAAPPRREIDSDVDLTTQVNVGDPTALRRRYLEERFPEIVNRTIVLDDPDSVVKAARLFYQEGAIPRAVELLQFATEENPEQVKPWLALFEIYRLERLTGEFADLARRFKEPHGTTEYWRKVQFFGREIEPANALYRDIAVGIETIKFEAGKPPPPSSYDPIAENWLASPMDFENEVLANELRRGLMNQAGLADQDLLPNPMPALRRVEMFTVA